MGIRIIASLPDNTLIENAPYNVQDKYYHRSSTTQIISIQDCKTKEYLDIETCIQTWEAQAITIQQVSSYILDTQSDILIDKMYDEQGKRSKKSADTLGEDLGLFLNSVNGYDLIEDKKFHQAFGNVSKTQRLIRHSVISCLRGTDTRQKDFDKKITELITGEKSRLQAGWARTVQPHASNPGKVLDFTPVGGHMSFIEERYKKTITYKIKCGKDFVLLTLAVPEHIHNAHKLSQPKFVWSKKTNDFSVILDGQYFTKKVKPSERYIIGIDVGITQYVTYSVIDLITDTVVETGNLSNYLAKEYYGKIRDTQSQIADCWRKVKILEQDADCFGLVKQENIEPLINLYKDIHDQRSALSRKRKTLACQAALELRDLSIKYDHALIVRENLTWVGNTMQNGRWNCGELFTRIQEKLQEIGLSSMWVSAWKTSQSCSSCGNMHKKILQEGDTQFHYDTLDRIVSCEECGYTADRDVNASINIARRGIFLLEKELEYYQDNPGEYDEREEVKPFKRSKQPLWLRRLQKKRSLEAEKHKRKKKKRAIKKHNRQELASLKDNEHVKKKHVRSAVRLPLEIVISRKVVKNYMSLLCPSLSQCFRGTVIDGALPALVIQCENIPRFPLK